MATALSELVTQLTADVPARNGVPTADQYARCVKGAVADFSHRTGRVKVTQLAIARAVAAYDLPADFIKLIRLAWPSLESAGGSGVLITSAGLVPVAADYRQTWTIAGGQIRFYPVPQFATTVDLYYQAGWVLDAAEEYPELGASESEICLLLAASRALELQANAAVAEAWSYQLGDERTSKEKLADAIAAQAAAQRSAYLAAVGAYIGLVGIFG